MRNLLAPLICLGVLATTSASAQRHRPRLQVDFDWRDAVEIGVTGGPNLTTFTGIGPVDHEVRGELGGFVSIPIADGLRLRPEVMVQNRAASVNQTFFPPCAEGVVCNPTTEKRTGSFTWVEAPLLLEARLSGALGGSLAPRLLAGPYLAVRLSCSFTTQNSTVADQAPSRTVQTCADLSNSTSYRNGDAGFVAGAGLTSGTFGVTVRWTRSLMSVSPSTADFLNGGKTSSLSVGFDFGVRLR